jgi:hypothetical protein
MNTHDTRHEDRAELARLLPALAERDLQADREQILKGHLMHELLLAGRPSAGKPAPARGRKLAIITAVAVAAAGAAAGAVLALLPASTPTASAAAVQLLAKIATAAAKQPGPPVGDSQFWYIKSWVAYESCDGSSGKCVLDKPHQRQVWQSVSDLCVAGLLREDGQSTPLTSGSGEKCPDPGGANDPTYRFLQSLPTNPRPLLTLIEGEVQGQQPPPEEAFTTIGDLLREAIAPPPVSAALYRSAALIPGVTVIPDATDAIGRHGVAVAMTSQGVQSEWIFSKQTLQYLGERDINTADGSTNGEAAVLQRAFVSYPGQVPG